VVWRQGLLTDRGALSLRRLYVARDPSLRRMWRGYLASRNEVALRDALVALADRLAGGAGAGSSGGDEGEGEAPASFLRRFIAALVESGGLGVARARALMRLVALGDARVMGAYDAFCRVNDSEELADTLVCPVFVFVCMCACVCTGCVWGISPVVVRVYVCARVRSSASRRARRLRRATASAARASARRRMGRLA
jgi:hypothetical protein